MITIEFKPWTRFRAAKRQIIVRRWLKTVGDAAQKVFTAGIVGGHSGRIYRRRGGTHTASAPGEFPARDTGGLLKSLRYRVGMNEVTIGTNVFYAKFLRNGTSKMARRRMSDDAMQEGSKKARRELRGWVAWSRG